MVHFGSLQVRQHETPQRSSFIGRLQNRRIPLLGAILHPVLELIRNLVERRGLLKRLNQPVEQQPVEAPVAESNAILVMFI